MASFLLSHPGEIGPHLTSLPCGHLQKRFNTVPLADNQSHTKVQLGQLGVNKQMYLKTAVKDASDTPLCHDHQGYGERAVDRASRMDSVLCLRSYIYATAMAAKPPCRLPC